MARNPLLLFSSLLISSCFGPDFPDGNLPSSAKDYRGRYRITSLAQPPAFDSFEVELFPDKDGPTADGMALIALSSAWIDFVDYGEPVRRWFFSPNHLPIIEWGELSYFRFTGDGTIHKNGWNGSVEYVSDFDGFGLEELPTPARAQRL
ncbi:MAG: hypothetical protein O3A95_07925 [Planctomycetota bacterium]|nr:hypothetical protein [Planctomycetota bacterium]MDA1114209.1 hypothetical protein [Planctomycetota bacterium]